MSPFGFWGLPAALLALLYCPGSGEKAPEQVAVKRGEPYKVNCTSSCPHPQIRGLETTLNKVELQKHAQWTEYLVSNVSQDTVMYCHFTCSGKQMSKTISVRVFHPPEQVLLELQPARVTVGRPFTIVCSVPAVAPLEKLTLTLLHGKKPLHTQTFGSGKDDPQEATATHNATAHKEDGHHNFSCRAELDLRSLGGDIISSVSEARALQVYAVAPETEKDLQGARSLEDPETDLGPTYMSGVSTTTAASGAPQGLSPALAEGLWQAVGLLGIFLFLM
ncbi:intercellular adhesion molecule 2 isoform X1 [Pteropus medius]|uniref:intercellular adhesion molecule 2 isoform X1 n=1 Tax=Pteropus vampyrus TaxID=132908 RepID=UPI00196B1C42|nr:intercellular adhesion molecule 2 isoform X1 [Pteropus giganteus]